MEETTVPPRPIVIVTGANGGVGYGICQRLLLQLCQAIPSDSRTQPAASEINANEPTKPTRFDGITLIMACRNMGRADAARNRLLHWFDAKLVKIQKRKKGDEESVRLFRERCDVQIAELDLANFSSVLKFAATMNQTIPYVSHVVFNAGVASISHIDSLACTKQFLTDPMGAFTEPTYYFQNTGEMTADNLGWVWQANVFGHFVLFRELEPLLAKTPFDTARVIWSSSRSAAPGLYDPDEDWQLIKTAYSYEGSKYQIDLIATHFERLPQPAQIKPIRHLISEPGICVTNISRGISGPVLKFFTVMGYYIARCFGSQYHTTHAFEASIAAVHLLLVPLAFLSNKDPDIPITYGARTNWSGHEYVDTSPVKEWESHEAESAALVKKCDTLYMEMKASTTTQ